jgi:hypothetical protein
MKWNNVENNCKALYEYQYINAARPAERKMLIQVIAKEFPDLTRMRIAHAVDRCIAAINAPMTPVTFVTFVQRYLS